MNDFTVILNKGQFLALGGTQQEWDETPFEEGK